MRLLGIDYGKRKIGLAISEGRLAEPWKVIRYKDTRILSEQLQRIIKENDVEKVVVGISEGRMAEESKKFAKRIGAETFDETLSTHDAQRVSIEMGIKRKKRKGMEDAYAAALILQGYLDSAD